LSGQFAQVTFTESAGTALNPSVHIKRDATTVANTSRFPRPVSGFQYLKRRSWPSGVRQRNFGVPPPSSRPGCANVHAMPASLVACSNV
jgi:hypothetical protein